MRASAWTRELAGNRYDPELAKPIIRIKPGVPLEVKRLNDLGLELIEPRLVCDDILANVRTFSIPHVSTGKQGYSLMRTVFEEDSQKRPPKVFL